MSSSSDWVHFYQNNVAGTGAGQVFPPTSRVSDSTVVTTTVTSGNTPNHMGAVHLNPEGRVSKPPRRRSRASRRTPTTLLNTDTTNFRAMVQQFTGIPSTPFLPAAISQSGGALNLNFRLGDRQNQNHQLIPNTNMISLGYHQQQQQQLHHQQQQQQQQQYQQQEYMLSMNNGSSSDGFLQGFGNPRPNLEVSDGYLIESSISSSNLLPRPSSNDSRTSNGYIL